MAGEVKILLGNIKNFRKWVLNEGVSESRIENAINSHETIYIYYAGDDTVKAGYRTIKPFVLGKYYRTKNSGNGTIPSDSNGQPVLRAWQDAGSSDSFRKKDGVKPRSGHEKFAGPHGEAPGWRLFKVGSITSLMPTGIRFRPEKYFNVDGVSYKPNDGEMTGIVASIPRTSTDDVSKEPFQKHMAASRKKAREITKDEVEGLLQIARKHRKEAYSKFWVVELENGEMALKTEKALARQKIPDAAVVGNLRDLYNKFIYEPRMAKDKKYFDDASKNAGI